MTLLLAAFFAVVVLTVTAGGLLYARWAGETDTTGSEVAGEDNFGAQASGLLIAIGNAFGSFQKDDGLRSLLFRAGHRSLAAVALFHGVQVAAGLGMALVMDWLALLRADDQTGLLLPAVCGLGFGYMIPKRVLEWQVKRRAQRLRRALPPALDLMVLALEAGQTIDQAVVESARSMCEGDR